MAPRLRGDDSRREDCHDNARASHRNRCRSRDVARLRAVLQGQDAHSAGQLRRRRQCRHRGARLSRATCPKYIPGQPDGHHPQRRGRRRLDRHEPARPWHRLDERWHDRRLFHHERDDDDDRRSGAQDQSAGLHPDRGRDRLERRLCAQGHRAGRLHQAVRFPARQPTSTPAAMRGRPRTTRGCGSCSRS